jgi:DNA-binding response OmpR family regulator
MPQAEQKVVVLVADDEPSTLALVASHVRSRGYQVLEAWDGDLAWELAHENLPDLVVLDVMMPGMSGWEVCRKIREAVSLAHTGVIMLTGIGENLNEMTSPLYGADTYLDKPFEFGKLDDCIRDVLARRKKDHAMGRPAETERPSSRPPAKATRANGLIVTTVAALAGRAAKGPKSKPAALKAKPPVKAKARGKVTTPKATPRKAASRKAVAPVRATATKAKPAAKAKAKALAGRKAAPAQAAKSARAKAPTAKTTSAAKTAKAGKAAKATRQAKPANKAAAGAARPAKPAKAARSKAPAAKAKAKAKANAKVPKRRGTDATV